MPRLDVALTDSARCDNLSLTFMRYPSTALFALILIATPSPAPVAEYLDLAPFGRTNTYVTGDMRADAVEWDDESVSTGIKQPHFHRLCCWEREPSAGTRYALYNSF